MYKLIPKSKNKKRLLIVGMMGNKKKTASGGACGLSGDPRAVTKIFIVTCATDSYEMCFCDTVPQIVVHFDLSGAKSGTKTAAFYCP